MIRFFIKGLLRDHQRSLLPILVVTMGVMLAVIAQTWITGIMGDMVDLNARFSTGHVKIMSREYFENVDQSLANAFREIRDGIENYSQNLAQYVQDIEAQVSKIVTHIAGATRELEASVSDLAEIMEERSDQPAAAVQ